MEAQLGARHGLPVIRFKAALHQKQLVSHVVHHVVWKRFGVFPTAAHPDNFFVRDDYALLRILRQGALSRVRALNATGDTGG